jgi:acetyl-CoA carboxylase carboxyl transferase subunit alpha
MSALPHEKQIEEYREAIRQFREEKGAHALLTDGEVRKLEQKLQRLQQKVYSQLTPWERVAICRHPGRPRSVDYIKALCGSTFEELHGDRLYGDDRAIIAGVGKIGGHSFAVIGQEKGHDTESRVAHNFGMPHPEGFRKALRVMRVAAKFQLPIVCFVDTPGAFPGLSAEARGQAWAIAENLREMMILPTPIIVVLIGEACSGGALAIAVGDRVGMLEHSYYSVISPEGCASILWKEAAQADRAAAALHPNSEDLVKLNVVDCVIKEPLGGAHHDPAKTIASVEEFILSSWAELQPLTDEALLEQRYLKFREVGSYTVVDAVP